MKRNGEPIDPDEPPEKITRPSSHDGREEQEMCMDTDDSIAGSATGSNRSPNYRPRLITVDDLPPEILLQIFSWFPVEELCTSLSLVCSRWYLISRHRGLWKNLRFDDHRTQTYHIVDILQHATALETLEIVDRFDARALLLQVASTNRRLRSLVVKRCEGTSVRRFINADVLMNVITHCPLLEQLVIKDTQFRSTKIWKAVGTSLPKLKRLNCSYNVLLSFEALGIIARTCNPLERLSIFCSFSAGERLPTFFDEDIRILSFRMRSTLQVLQLSGSKLTNDSFEAISTCLQLHTLHIRDAPLVSDSGITMLTKLPLLTSLAITMTQRVSASAWYELFRHSNWKDMCVISLDACENIDDHVLDCIGSVYPDLKCITLQSCKHFTKDGFASLIRGCNNLVHLNLLNTKRELTEVFGLLPEYTPLLQILFYEYYYNITQKRVLDELKDKLPNLKIKRRNDRKRDRTFLGYNM